MNSPGEQQKRIGGHMLFAMWLLLLAFLVYFFDGVLENKRNPNKSVNTVQLADGSREVRLQRNDHGSYVTTGTINNMTVVFLVDTGASDIAIPEHVAEKLQLKKGAQTYYQTANGEAISYLTRLDKVAIGNIELRDVRASIGTGIEFDEILLGMSFLKQVNFRQEGNTLILQQR